MIFSPQNSVAARRAAIIFLLLLAASFYFLRSIYIPIFISYFLAFMLNPLITLAERRGFGRGGPIFVVLFLFFLLMSGFAVLLLPKLLSQLRALYERLPMLISALSERFSPYSIRYFGYDIFTQWQEIVQEMIPAVARPAAGFLESFLAGTLRALSALLTVLMIPILTFYFLKDYRQLNQAVVQLVPRRYLPDVQEVSKRLSVVLGSLIRGQFLVCLILSAYYSVALAAVGTDVALVLGIFSGFMNLVPFVGPLLSMALAILFTLLGGGGLAQCIAVLGVYLVANLIEGTLLTPRIVGRQVGISPLVIILGLLAGGELLGFLGVLLALPVMAMAKVLGGYLRERYLDSEFYRQGSSSSG